MYVKKNQRSLAEKDPLRRRSQRNAGGHLGRGMQGWRKDGCWVVLFPQCGEKEDIADLYRKEEDLKEVPVMNVKLNEQIKAKSDALSKRAGCAGNDADDNSAYMI